MSESKRSQFNRWWSQFGRDTMEPSHAAWIGWLERDRMAEVAAAPEGGDSKDLERYRWLAPRFTRIAITREAVRIEGPDIVTAINELPQFEKCTKESVDAAVDAAMASRTMNSEP